MAVDMKLDVGIKGLKQGTNILEIDVPAPLKRRVKTGIEWFDDSVGGQGLTPSMCMLLTGTPGAGKTTAAIQLAESIPQQGHICLFNTGEESLYQVRNVCDRLRVKHGFVCGQDFSATKFLAHADMLRARDPKKEIIIIHDSLQTMDDGKYKDGGTTGNTPVRVIKQLAEWCKKSYGICIVIGQVTKSGEFAGKNTIKHAVDCHGHLYIDDDKKSETWGERLYTVSKNRFGVNGRTYVMGMTEGGLIEKGRFQLSI